jgi:hypothetical protein
MGKGHSGKLTSGDIAFAAFIAVLGIIVVGLLVLIAVGT